MDLTQLRNLVRMHMDNHLYKSAEFWADKICTLSSNDPQDVLLFSHTLFLTKQYLRAAHVLKANLMISSNPVAKYIAAKCYYECKEFRMALQILDDDNVELRVAKSGIVGNDTALSTAASEHSTTSSFLLTSVGGARKIESALSLLRGMVFEALEYKEFAMQCYKDALQYDVYCYEAFDLLISHNTMTNSEENQLLQMLPFEQQCNKEEAGLVKLAYELKINKYMEPVELILPPHLQKLQENMDYKVCLAERHFNSFNYNEALKHCTNILQKDSLHKSCLPLYIACLVELKMKNKLYSTANRLVNTYPGQSVSWYAIGAYYLLITRYEAARKYFGKSTAIDIHYGPAWLGFAHSYASEGEHDQAISAYYSAAKYMPGSHLPYLYLGLQYSLSSNLKLATKFYKEALARSPDDPQTKLELGNISFQNGDYVEAEMYFLQSLKHFENAESYLYADFREPLFNNLGHTSRKLKKYPDALVYHEKALLLNPKNPSTFSAIGLLLMIQGNFEKAIFVLHQALSLKRDDIISIQLLNQALELLTSSNEHTVEVVPANSIEITTPSSIIDLSCKSNTKTDNNLSISDMSLEMSDIST